jgi:hypothetical protein
MLNPKPACLSLPGEQSADPRLIVRFMTGTTGEPSSMDGAVASIFGWRYGASATKPCGTGRASTGCGEPWTRPARCPGPRRRDKQAAERLLRKLLKKEMRPPRVMITNKLASYGAATREVMHGIEQRQHKRLNNRAENSHRPTRRRERQLKQFKSAGQAQRLLSAHDQINNFFHLRRDHVTSAERSLGELGKLDAFV